MVFVGAGDFASIAESEQHECVRQFSMECWEQEEEPEAHRHGDSVPVEVGNVEEVQA